MICAQWLKNTLRRDQQKNKIITKRVNVDTVLNINNVLVLNPPVSNTEKLQQWRDRSVGPAIILDRQLFVIIKYVLLIFFPQFVNADQFQNYVCKDFSEIERTVELSTRIFFGMIWYYAFYYVSFTVMVTVKINIFHKSNLIQDEQFSIWMFHRNLYHSLDI